MQIKSVDNYTFGSKNTFLLKSWHATSKVEQDYYRSLRHEAKSRLNYIKFKKDLRNVDRHSDLETLEDNYEVTVGLVKTLYHRLMSVIYKTKSHKEFPNRFAEPDDKLAKVKRHYKIKEDYMHLIKS